MKHEEVLRQEAEMKETLHEEQLRNQDAKPTVSEWWSWMSCDAI